jgi:hypothetical protein
VQTIIADVKARALHQGSPIVVVLDFSRASRLASTAHIMLADLTRTQHVRTMICVARDSTMAQASRAVAAMSERGRVHQFESMNEARLFAQVCAHNFPGVFA